MFETVYIMLLICLLFMIRSFLVSLVDYCAYYYTTSNGPTKEECNKIINVYSKMYFKIYLFTMLVYFLCIYTISIY